MKGASQATVTHCLAPFRTGFHTVAVAQLSRTCVERTPDAVYRLCACWSTPTQTEKGREAGMTRGRQLCRESRKQRPSASDSTVSLKGLSPASQFYSTSNTIKHWSIQLSNTADIVFQPMKL